MCLIAFAIQASARWPLVIASNRDEAYERPTMSLSRWTGPAGHTILSGRDLRDGGTWLGISRHGRVAMLTNVRMPPFRSGVRSRGELVVRWLDSADDYDTFCQRAGMPAEADLFGGFNLVTGDVLSGEWHWTSNASDGNLGTLARASLAPGVYGLSNALLDTPWPKTKALKAALEKELHHTSFGTLSGSLLPSLLDATPATHEQLPDTGVGLQRERLLSSAFVKSDTYGTRSSAVVGLHAPGGDAPGAGRLYFREWAHHPAPGCHQLEEDWPKSNT